MTPKRNLLPKKTPWTSHMTSPWNFRDRQLRRAPSDNSQMLSTLAYSTLRMRSWWLRRPRTIVTEIPTLLPVVSCPRCRTQTVTPKTRESRKIRYKIFSKSVLIFFKRRRTAGTKCKCKGLCITKVCGCRKNSRCCSESCGCDRSKCQNLSTQPASMDNTEFKVICSFSSKI